VTTRIARAAAHIAQGQSERVVLGHLDAEVDWGFAGDYVEAMRLMLEAPQPADYVISSGTLHRVRDFVELAFQRVGIDWHLHVSEDREAHRPVSRAPYYGNSTRIRRQLGWQPRTTFSDLVGMMVDHHLAAR
jgi:GDPmannose 4,6-dehydratase